MKYLLILIVSFLLLSFSSCDYSIYVGVRNYKPPCKVSVSYERFMLLNNSDTLYLVSLQNDTVRSQILRKNTSDTSYTFVAPQNFEIGLNPTSLGTPTRHIQISQSADSVWTLPAWNDGKALRKLKKAGLIEYKGFLIFRHTIIINNR